MQDMLDKIHEECGVFGIYDNDDMGVVESAYMALYALQHRGQESCGTGIWAWCRTFLSRKRWSGWETEKWLWGTAFTARRRATNGKTPSQCRFAM